MSYNVLREPWIPMSDGHKYSLWDCLEHAHEMDVFPVHHHWRRTLFIVFCVLLSWMRYSCQIKAHVCCY